MKVFKIKGICDGLMFCNSGYNPIENDDIKETDIESLLLERPYEFINFLSKTKYIHDGESVIIFSNIINHIDMARMMRFDCFDAGFIDSEGKTYGESVSLALPSKGLTFPEFGLINFPENTYSW